MFDDSKNNWKLKWKKSCLIVSLLLLSYFIVFLFQSAMNSSNLSDIFLFFSVQNDLRELTHICGSITRLVNKQLNNQNSFSSAGHQKTTGVSMPPRICGILSLGEKRLLMVKAFSLDKTSKAELINKMFTFSTVIRCFVHYPSLLCAYMCANAHS